jgi:type I restriction enzyme M protein
VAARLLFFHFITFTIMSKKYEAPIEVRSLEKLITDFSYHNGLNVRDVFDDLLVYIIHGFSPLAPPLKT